MFSLNELWVPFHLGCIQCRWSIWCWLQWWDCRLLSDAWILEALSAVNFCSLRCYVSVVVDSFPNLTQMYLCLCYSNLTSTEDWCLNLSRTRHDAQQKTITFSCVLIKNSAELLYATFSVWMTCQYCKTMPRNALNRLLGLINKNKPRESW